MRQPTLSLSYALAIVLAFIVLGATAMHYLEGWSWVDSFYWTVLTLTTIGSTEFNPTTDVSKMFVTVYILVGVSIVLYALSHMATLFMHSQTDNVKKFREFRNGFPKKLEDSVQFKRNVNKIKYKMK